MREIKHYKGVKGLFDTHAHLYDDRFAEEERTPEDVLSAAFEAGVTRILIPADSVSSSKKAIEYVKSYDGLYGVDIFCSVGVHPHEAKDYDDGAEAFIRACLEKKDEIKCKAIGEIGLDYYYDLSPREVQKEVYEAQLRLCYEYDMPFILHERDATGDSLEVLRRFYKAGNLRKSPGVCHCCSCSPEAAAELVKMGFYIGFDGPITFKNNKKTPVVCEETPLERIVIETDSPYLTPEPNRGVRNEPEFVFFVAEKIAQIKNMSVEEIIKVTYDNGNRLYEI